jgi:galactokinase/mevalonate kinase-like predicted kinase
MIQASAPGRCGIVGNPSDIYGGTVVSCSLPLRATCTLNVNAPDEEDLTLWLAVSGRFPISGQTPISRSDIPRSSGLAGSTALLAAMVACALVVRGEQDSLRDPTSLAELVRDIERNEAGIICGYQDAYMAVCGGLQRMDFEGKHPIDSGPPAKMTAIQADLPFLVITTDVQRLSGSVHGPMSERWLRGETAVVEGMARIAELGRAGAEALECGDWTTLARAMTENQEVIASLGGSGEVVDQLIQECIQHGAMAAKLAGAGMGGSVIALTDDPQELQPRLTAEGYAKFVRPSIQPGLQWTGQHSPAG